MVCVLSLIGFYIGHFLFKKPEPAAPDTDKNRSSSTLEESVKNSVLPVSYKHLSKLINGNQQEINILEVDLGKNGVEIAPVLSHNKLFGFEKLSSIALRSNAYAAVNGGFFHEYGYPSGMVVIDGSLVTRSTGKYPVLIINEGRAALRELNTELWIESGGKRLNIDHINSPAKPGEIILYTPVYGLSNRVDMKNISVIIKNNTVKRISGFAGETDIPDQGMLLTFIEPHDYNISSFPFKEGDSFRMHFKPDFGGNAQAYECGSWIVRNGEIVIGERDEWVGVMTNRDPRTVVGLKDDRTVVLLTVDGRQPGYSAGLTGRELGSLLLELGIKDAAMLDGGASTEMIVQSQIVNKPSFKGQERPLGGALVVKLKQHD